MEAQKYSIKSTKSDVIVFFLATMIVCTLVGKGIFSLRDTGCNSLLYSTKK